MPLTLHDIPEEILERIFALAIVAPLPDAPYPRHPNIISPLLVCRSWLRIATPVHYRHPILRTPRHAELLLRALRHTPELAPCVRSLHVHATSPALRDIVPLCYNLDTLDITVDNAGEGPRGSAVVDFCEAFMRTRSIRHLVIRKNAYLTQPNAIHVFEQLAKAISRWPKLETVNVAFRLSPSPAASALTQALAAAPRLHTLQTQLPAVWNTTLLDIAQNPALARIVLSPRPELAGAHLFIAEAKRHPRLLELFRTARARAASAVIPNPPMPIATWGYERDVPPPTCPPSRRTPQHAYGPPPTMVGPSAYAYALPPAPTSQYPQQAGPQHHLHPHAQYPGQYPSHSHSHGAPTIQYQHHSGAPMRAALPHASAPQPQPPFVGGQAPRRSGPGNRRMTAS
ncbi:hypothetical protein C8Q74DRAFT_1318493 [Fomes fomentarius]|nr:hypothetical protein C8Q74DRAFT_1318493 [Fomes fomentarius]